MSLRNLLLTALCFFVVAMNTCQACGISRVTLQSREAYFRKLLQKGTSAPLSKFLMLWNPANQVENRASYFDDCLDAKGFPFRRVDNIVRV